MHFVILGAGALGSILAAILARAGHRVQLIARGPRAEWLRQHGVRIDGLRELDVECEIVGEPEQLRGADVFINTVKTYDTATALAQLARLAPATALSVQNGVVKDEQLAQAFGATAVIGAMADFSGELAASGSVAFTRNVCLHLGELPGGTSARVWQLTEAIDSAGVNARAADNILSLEWSKYAGWVALMTLAVLTRRETGNFLVDPDTALLAARSTREMGRLAERLRIPLIDVSPVPVQSIVAGSESAAVEIVQALGRTFIKQAPAHRMSSLQDVLRGRPLELEETVGYALAKAETVGLQLPTVEICYRLCAAVNRGSHAGPVRH